MIKQKLIATRIVALSFFMLIFSFALIAFWPVLIPLVLLLVLAAGLRKLGVLET